MANPPHYGRMNSCEVQRTSFYHICASLLLLYGASAADIVCAANAAQRDVSFAVRNGAPRWLMRYTIDSDDDKFLICKIAIVDATAGTVIQDLQLPHDCLQFDEQPALSEANVTDVNFDSYLDIHILYYTASGGNDAEIFWLYNPQQKAFVYNDELSGLPGVEIDKVNKTILSSSHCCLGSESQTEIYRWTEMGQLELIEKRTTKPLVPQPTDLRASPECSNPYLVTETVEYFAHSRVDKIKNSTFPMCSD